MCRNLGTVLGRLDETRRRTAAVIGQACAVGDPVLVREALALDGFLAAMASEAGAGDRLREAVRRPGLADTPLPFWAPGIWDPENALASLYLWCGEFDLARELLNTVIAAAEGHGSDDSAAFVRINPMRAEWQPGNWDAAAAYAAAYARWSRETGIPSPEDLPSPSR